MDSSALSMLGTPDDATDDRHLPFKKSLCVCERREGTVEHVSPNKQHRHLFLEVAFGPRTRFGDRPTRPVLLGTEKVILVRVLERGVRLAICGIIHAIDDQLTSFLRCHTQKNSTLTAGAVPESSELSWEKEETENGRLLARGGEEGGWLEGCYHVITCVELL